MNIGFCFNVLHDSSGKTRELDFDAPETIEGIAKAIESLGHAVIRIEADENIFEKLKKLKGKIDGVFNIAEGLHGDARESWVPFSCEILKIPYTHSTPTVLALCLDKRLCKLAVKGLGINVPEENRFPAIIKPVSEGSSMGIFEKNIVKDKKECRQQIAELRKMGIGDELMIEKYIEGREFTVGILAGEVLPIVEQKFPNGLKIAGYEMKWEVETKIKDPFEVVECPANLTTESRRQITDICERIYNGLGIRDVARIDLRMKTNGEIYFLEINPLPGLIPDENILSYLPLAARVAGYKYEQIIEKILLGLDKRWAVGI